MVDFSDSSQGQIAQLEVPNSERNKLNVEDRRFHDWYRFVLSFPAHLVRDYLDEFNLTKDDIVLDPFCGTGTTIVEAKLRGIPSIGLEANRFAHFAGSVKVNWGINPDVLSDIAASIRDQVIKRLDAQGVPDEAPERTVIKPNLLGLEDDQMRLILKDSISPVPLHKILVLKKEIDRYAGVSAHKYLRLALAKTIVFKASNLRFGPEVGIGKRRVDVPVISAWFSETEQIVDDLRSIDPRDYPHASVQLLDSRDIGSCLKDTKVAAVITSPPYPNEKDYTRTTRLESVILNFIKDKNDLRAMKKTLLRSNTRGVYKGDDDDRFVEHIVEIQKLADQIEARRLELGKTSGFERMYPRLTKLYFGGMARHLQELQKVLQPGAMLAYVVGDQASYLRVMIRTGHLLAKIAESAGYEVVRIDTFRTRFSTATKDWLNEEVVILRWKG
jgi:hypothetical protein